METRSSRLLLFHRLVPTLIDLATFAGFLFLSPWLGEQIFAQSPVNHYFLVPGFFLIVFGIIAIRSLPEYALDDEKGPSFFAICLVFFVVVIYSLLYSYATNIGGSESGNDGVAMIVFFVFLLPVLVAFVAPATRAEPETAKALIAESVGLFSVNYLTLIGASIWYQFSSLPTGDNPVYATGIWFLILYGIMYLLFLGFFGLPRIYMFRATGNKIGLATYLLGVAVFLWDKIPPVN
jgi:hypothetical protein